MRRDDDGASEVTVSDNSAHGSDTVFAGLELRNVHTPTKPSIAVDEGLDTELGEKTVPPHATETTSNGTRDASHITGFTAPLYTALRVHNGTLPEPVDPAGPVERPEPRPERSTRSLDGAIPNATRTSVARRPQSPQACSKLVSNSS